MIPGHVKGSSLSFIPNVANKYGAIRIRGGGSWLETQTNTRNFSLSTISLRETLDIGLNGFSYHPNFLQYLFKGSFGASQNKIASQWRNGSAEEYEITAKLLPYHRYNLEVSLRQERPLLLGLFGGNPGRNASVIKDTTAILNYIQKNWSGTTQYLLREKEGIEDFTSEGYDSSLRIKLNPVYLKGFYKYTTIDSRDERTIRSDIIGNGSFRTKILRFNTEYFQEEEDRSKNYIDTGSLLRKDWLNTLGIDLPLNFNVRLNHNERNTDVKSIAPIRGEIISNYNSENQGLNVYHHIFQSVNTSFSYTNFNIVSSTGESNTKNTLFSAIYRKKIFGNQFTGDYRIGKTRNKNDGALTNIFEKKSGGTFTLNSRDINESTIAILVKDPAFPNIAPEEVTDYTIFPKGAGIIEITINSVEPSTHYSNADIDNYDYLVSYDLIEADYEIERKNEGYGLRFSLFSNSMTAYYSFHRSVPTDIQGNIDRTSISGEETVKRYLLNFKLQPFYLEGQYAETLNTDTMADIWKLKGDYKKDFSSNSSFTATIQHEELDSVRSVRYSEEKIFSYRKSTGGSISLDQSFLVQRLASQYKIGYAKFFSDSSDGYSFFGLTNIHWNIGKTKLNLDIRYDIDSSSNSAIKEKRKNASAYISMVRKIF